MLRVIVDTNQFVSAIISKTGASARLLDAWRNRKFILVISEEIIDEVREVLLYPKIMEKYHLAKDDIRRFIHLLEHEAVVITNPRSVDIIQSDPDDNKFLACALKAKADFIVSGDRHLLELNSLRSIKIVTVSEFMRLLD